LLLIKSELKRRKVKTAAQKRQPQSEVV